jgi:hypothetical protein
MYEVFALQLVADQYEKRREGNEEARNTGLNCNFRLNDGVNYGFGIFDDQHRARYTIATKPASSSGFEQRWKRNVDRSCRIRDNVWLECNKSQLE